MENYTQDKIEQKRTAIGSFAITAMVCIASIAATILGLAQMA